MEDLLYLFGISNDPPGGRQTVLFEIDYQTWLELVQSIRGGSIHTHTYHDSACNVDVSCRHSHTCIHARYTSRW
jgi:hypothetical protein